MYKVKGLFVIKKDVFISNEHFLKGLDCNVTLDPILIVSPKSTLFNPKTEVFSGRTVRVRPGAPPKTVMKQKADKRGGVPCFFCLIR